MCGPIAAAASATENASSVLTATAVMLPSPTRSCVSVRGRSLVDVIGVVEEVDISWRLPEPRQQHGGVAELLLRVCVDVQHVIPERKALFRRRTWLAVFHPIGEAEERLEILPAHGIEGSAAMRRTTFLGRGRARRHERELGLVRRAPCLSRDRDEVALVELVHLVAALHREDVRAVE